MSKTKKLLGGLLAAVVALVVCLGATGCNKSTLAADTTDGTVMTVTAESCKKDDLILTSIEIKEGDALVVHSEMSKGALHFAVGEASGDEDIDELPDTEATLKNARLLFDCEEGTMDASFELDPGFYNVQVTGDDANPATGNVTLASGQAK